MTDDPAGLARPGHLRIGTLVGILGDWGGRLHRPAGSLRLGNARISVHGIAAAMTCNSTFFALYCFAFLLALP